MYSVCTVQELCKYGKVNAFCQLACPPLKIKHSVCAFFACTPLPGYALFASALV